MAFRIHFTERDVDALAGEIVLPQPFFFGAATAAYQVEGGYNGEGQPWSNWALLERDGKVELSGDACRAFDFADVDLGTMQRMGLNMDRISLEWARLQPDSSPLEHPDNPPPFDDGALRLYARYVAGMLDRGLEPCLTLHHFVHPLWAGLDFWLDRGRVVELFPRYVEYTVRGLNRLLVGELGKRPVRYWITINEVNLLAMGMYLDGRLPHRAPTSTRNTLAAYNNMLIAHCLAYDTVHRVYREEGWGAPQVSTNTNSNVLYHVEKIVFDLLCARENGISRDDLPRYLDDSYRAWSSDIAQVARPRVPFGLARAAFELTLAGMSRRVYKAESFADVIDTVYASELPSKLDYLAFDYYDPFPRTQFGVPPPGELFLNGKLNLMADLSRQVLNPAGMRQFIRGYLRTCRKPVLIAENGMCHSCVNGRCRPRPDRATRDRFVRAYLFEVARAVREGLPVMGYLHWSLIDNYEWGSYAPRFGLFSTDYEHGADRKATDAFGVNAAGAYAEIAQALASGERKAIREAFLSESFPSIAPSA